MPSCEHGHKHPPWPKVGPLVICPGERSCEYCDWKTSDRESAPTDAKMDNGAAQVLRKHVYHEHTDGGKEDRSAVEVMLYRPGLKKKKGESMGKFSRDDEDVEDEFEGNSYDKGNLGRQYEKAATKYFTLDHAEMKPSLQIRLKVAAKARPSDIDTRKAQDLLQPRAKALQGRGAHGNDSDF